MVQCPRCKLVNPPHSKICDCGYELQLPPGMQAADMRQPATAASRKRPLGYLLIGLVFLGWAAFLISIRGNNLAGIAMIVVIPAGLILIAAGLLLIATG